MPNAKKYKYLSVFVLITLLFGFSEIFSRFNILNVFNINKVSAANLNDIPEDDDDENEKDEEEIQQFNTTDEKTNIKSVIPYVEKTENGVAQNVPVESREDVALYKNSLSLRIQVYLDSEDAKKYHGNSLYIFKLKPYQEITDIENENPATSFTVKTNDSFLYTIPLFVDLDSNLRNGEIYNKFIVAAKDGELYVPISGAHYINNINSLSNRREIPPVSKTKKGLSEIQMLGEASLLGVGYATVQMNLNDFMSSEPTQYTETYIFAGEDFYFNIDKISEYDSKIKYLTNEGINVTAEILLSADEYLQSAQKQNEQSQQNDLNHQNTETNSANTDNTNNTDNSAENADNTEDSENSADTDSGALEAVNSVNPVEYLIHPNVFSSAQNNKPFYYGINATDENGYKYFAALMSFIADRYVKEDLGYGRIYNIILGSEIGRTTMYNYCGQINMSQYVHDYMLALRICDTAIRSRFGGSRVYVPFDNWFAAKPGKDGDFINKEILDLLCEYSAKEGNFLWNVAFHAYNENRQLPECWNETSPADNYDTPIITMKNITVLCDYLNLEKKNYLPVGETRKVMLSGQGFSSVDNSKANMDLQAASFVYAYIKAKYIPDISAFIYHAQVDNANEIGSFGLWTNEDGTIHNPGIKKRIYDVFKYMDTNREAEQVEFAKNIIGINDFTEIVPFYSENTEPAVILTEAAGKSLSTAPSAWNIALFNKAGLSGFINSTNVADMSLAEYKNENSTYNGRKMLYAGFPYPKKGDFGGIFKIYTLEDAVLDLTKDKYVGLKMRVDTHLNLPEDQKIQVMLILEGESNETGIAGGAVSSESSDKAAANSHDTAKPINVYEGITSINPNEDTTVYFDISQWDERINIKKVKLLVNPYSNLPHTSSTNQNISPVSDDINNVNGRKYDFNLYVFSIVAARPSTMAIFQTILTIVLVTVFILAGAYGALYIRARIIRERRRREKERARERLRKRRAATSQMQIPSSSGTATVNNRQLPPGSSSTYMRPKPNRYPQTQPRNMRRNTGNINKINTNGNSNKNNNTFR